jgi:hypothetical protein
VDINIQRLPQEGDREFFAHDTKTTETADNAVEAPLVMIRVCFMGLYYDTLYWRLVLLWWVVSRSKPTIKGNGHTCTPSPQAVNDHSEVALGVLGATSALGNEAGDQTTVFLEETCWLCFSSFALLYITACWLFIV